MEKRACERAESDTITEMFGLSSKKGKSRALAAAFAGSSSAGCVVVGVNPQGESEVVAASYKALPLSAQSGPPTAAVIAAACGECCAQAADAYARSTQFKALGPVKESYGIIHAPWVSSRFGMVRKNSETPQLLTDAFIRERKNEALQAAGIPKEAVPSLCESLVTHVEIDGYPTLVTAKRSARRFALTALASACDPTIQQGLTDAIVKAFTHVPVLCSDVQVLLTITADHRKKHPDCTIVHMTSAATFIIVVRDGAPAGAEVVPHGVRTLIESLGQEDALTKLRLLAHDSCSKDECAKIQESLAVVEPQLAKGFGEAYSSLSKDRRIPNTLILVAHPDITDWLSSFFERIDFAPFTVTTRPLEPQVLQAGELQNHILWSAPQKEEQTLSEAAAFVNRKAR
ncbi:hypothetical protein EBR66_02740 [bacterium]|nr:hypothetical protein [bacterium]